MFISVRRYKQGAGTAQELARRVEDEFIPIVSAAPGFKAYHVVDAGEDVVVSVNIFDDRAGAEESDRRAAEWVRERLGEFQLSQVEITEGEVLASRG
jgi:hypothetical protein